MIDSLTEDSEWGGGLIANLLRTKQKAQLGGQTHVEPSTALHDHQPMAPANLKRLLPSKWIFIYSFICRFYLFLFI